MDDSPDRRQREKWRKIPAGFEFRPLDWELVLYLRRRVHGAYVDEGLFHEVNLYNYHPSKLIEQFAVRKEKKAYLFSPRSRKYPNGSRPCRSAGGGFWKASGKHVPVKNAKGEAVGTKRALSFYEGHQATKGKKTNWLMHEFKLIDEPHRPPPDLGCSSSSSSTTLDEWVLCVVYLHQKTSHKDGSDEGRRGEEEDNHINNCRLIQQLIKGSPREEEEEEEALPAVIAAPPYSDQTNTAAPVLHIYVDAAAAAAVEVDKPRRGKDAVMAAEPANTLYGYGTCWHETTDHTYASSSTFMNSTTMDPQAASSSALDPVLTAPTMEQLAPLPSVSWSPSTPCSFRPAPPPEFFHQCYYDHHRQDYYSTGMPFDTAAVHDCPISVPPLNVIYPKVDGEMPAAPSYANGNFPSSCAYPSTEPGDQPAAGGMMEPAGAPNGTGSNYDQMPPLEEVMPSLSDHDKFWNDVPLNLQLDSCDVGELSVDDYLVSDVSDEIPLFS